MTLYIGWSHDSVETVLRRRGQTIKRTGDPTELLLPTGDLLVEASEAYLEAFNSPWRVHHRNHRNLTEEYHLLYERRSFRRFLMGAIQDEQSHPISDLSQSLSMNESLIESYAEVLCTLSRATLKKGILTAKYDRKMISNSSEEHVSWLCSSHLRGHGEWGVRLQDLSGPGGDYDVIGWLDPLLISSECKSGSPRNIDRGTAELFLRRHQALTPDMSIIAIDSHANLATLIENLNGIISDAMHGHNKGWPRFRISESGNSLNPRFFQSQQHGNIWINESFPIYAVTIREGFLAPFQHCLRHYYGRWRGTQLLWRNS